jgi:hypothetical protein
MKNIKTRAVNDEIQAGDLVIATPDDCHFGLIGRVICINPVGSEAHNQETANETDDVHVDFLDLHYPKKRIKEIEAVFSDLYGEKKPFNEIPLDDVIMAPCCLIRLTGIDEGKLEQLLESGLEAVKHCYTVLSNLAYAATSAVRIPGNNNTNREMSEFKISRIINGYSLDFNLTKQELLDAFSHQEHKYNYDSIFMLLEQMSLEGSLQGRTAADIFADNELIKRIVDEFEETREEYDSEWRIPATAAIIKFIGT